MRKQAILFAVVLLSWSHSISAQTYIGPNMQCSAFLEKYRSNELVLGYIQGYLSGTAFMVYVTQGQKDILKKIQPLEAVGAVMGFCQENPTKTLLNGLNEITILLSRGASGR